MFTPRTKTNRIKGWKQYCPKKLVNMESSTSTIGTTCLQIQGKSFTYTSVGGFSFLPLFGFHLSTCREFSQSRQWHPLQSSCLDNPMDGGAWQAAVHGVAKSWTRLRDFTFTFHFQALEKEMAAHSSVLALRIPGTGKPGGLPSMGSHRVGHD